MIGDTIAAVMKIVKDTEIGTGMMIETGIKMKRDGKDGNIEKGNTGRRKVKKRERSGIIGKVVGSAEKNVMTEEVGGMGVVTKLLKLMPYGQS